MSAAAASRDITLFHAMSLLHKCKYDFAKASLKLVEGSSPHLSTDQMEDWTTAEAGLFEEAMEKYGKGFNDIWTDFLPWKTVKNIVEYYYMWKTTDRYVQQKRVKAVESEHKLKQVSVSNNPHYKQAFSKMFEVLSFVLVYTFSFPGVCPRLCQAWRRSSSSISLCWRSLPMLQDHHCHCLVMEVK